jgi:hypothetical protein
MARSELFKPIKETMKTLINQIKVVEPDLCQRERSELHNLFYNFAQEAEEAINPLREVKLCSENL